MGLGILAMISWGLLKFASLIMCSLMNQDSILLPGKVKMSAQNVNSFFSFLVFALV